MKKNIKAIILSCLVLIVGAFTVSYFIHLEEKSAVEKFHQDINSFTSQVTNNLKKDHSNSSMSLGSDIKNKKITVTIEIPENEKGKQTNDHIKSIIERSAKMNGLDSFSFKIDIKNLS